LTGVILPNLVRPVFMASMAITSPIGHVVGTVLLALIYFGMITPIAMIFRLMGRDALRLKPGKATSYWQDHVPTADVNQYLRQYQPQTAPQTQKSSSTVAITDNIAGSKHAQTI